MTAVILPPQAESFYRVAGLSLLQRAALSALRGGFDAVIALRGAEECRLRDTLRRDRRTASMPVVGEEELAHRVRTEWVVLIPSDCLVTPATLQRVRRADGGAEAVVFTDPRQADGRGLLRCRLEMLPHFRSVLHGGSATSLPVVTASLNGDLWVHVTDTATARAAEDQLVAQLRESTTETDGPLARLDRGLSTRISRWLVRTPLRPNHITTIGTLIGLLAAWSLARGTYLGGVAGAVLFWCAVILDGCDGEVARLKFLETRWGGLYDVVTDNVVHAAVFVGLVAGCFRSGSSALAPVFAVLLLGGFACALLATYFCLLRHPPVKRLQPRSRAGRIRRALLRGFDALMNRDFAYLLVLLALAGHLAWFVWGAALGTYAYAGGLVAVYLWREAP